MHELNFVLGSIGQNVEVNNVLQGPAAGEVRVSLVLGAGAACVEQSNENEK